MDIPEESGIVLCWNPEQKEGASMNLEKYFSVENGRDIMLNKLYDLKAAIVLSALLQQLFLKKCSGIP